MNWYGCRDAHDNPWRPRYSFLRYTSPPVSPPEADLLPPRPGIPRSRLPSHCRLGVPRLRQPPYGNRSEWPPLYAGGGTGHPPLNPAPYLGIDNRLQTEGASTRQPPGRRPQVSPRPELPTFRVHVSCACRCALSGARDALYSSTSPLGV